MISPLNHLQPLNGNNRKIKRSLQKVYDVIKTIKSGSSVKDYYEQTQENMKRRGAKRKSNRYQETCGKQFSTSSIHSRKDSYS